MISVEEAIKVILKSVNTLGSEVVDITQSLGRVLAEDVDSQCNIPAFDYSAMDGYAVRSLDTKGASSGSPKRLRVVAELKAGDLPSAGVKEGEAIKIMTGAPIPEGADAVIMVENTRIEDDTVVILKEVEEGENIRRIGEDVKKGDVVIQEGTLLREAHVGMLAALGVSRVRVTQRPRIAILTTGDEVINIEEELKPGKVRNANAYSLYSQVLRWGGIPVDMGIARDEVEQLREKLEASLEHDLVLTSGGVSMGEYDLVKDVLIEMGMDVKFWKVAIRPGKPVLFGILRGKPVFGLPGNPVSSMVSFEVFVRPAILKMLNQRDEEMREVEAILEEDIKKKEGLRAFLRAKTRWKNSAYYTRTTGPQGSGILSSMVLANSLIILPEDKTVVRKGEKVCVRFLS
jgi:molybdopterin molybdotransferase